MGAFLCDVDVPYASKVMFIQSMRPHEKIVEVVLAHALTMPGVMAAFSGAGVDMPGKVLPFVNMRREISSSPPSCRSTVNASDTLGAQKMTYDEGDCPRCLEMALTETEVEEFERMRAYEHVRGRLVGIGFPNHVEQTAIGPFEDAEVRLLADGRVLIFDPVFAIGQGTEITLCQNVPMN